MRTALKLIAALIGVIVIAIVAIIVLVPTDRIAQIAADQVKAATGRDLTLAGGVSPSFFPVIGVETGAVTLSNAEWASEETMISASSAKVGVELLPLISGEIKVSEVRLIDPVIALEVSEDGTPNWQFAAAEDAEAAPAQEGEGFVKSVSLGEAVIENGAVSFVDRSTGQAIAVEAINATIALEALDAPLSVAGDAVWNGEKTELALTLETPAAAMAGEAIAFDVALSSAMAEVSANGEATPPAPGAQPVLNTEFAVKAASPAAALTWATGQTAPPALLEISALDVSGAAEMNASGAAVDVNGSAARDGQTATVALKAAGGADWAETMALDVDLTAAVGDLARVAYQGAVGMGQAGPVLEGSYSVAAADPAGAAAWATGAAPEGLAGLSDLGLEGEIEMNDAGLIATAAGGVARDGARATVDLKASSGADWATRRAFDIALNAGLADLAQVNFIGAAAAPDGAAPSLNGDFKLNAPNLKGLAAFAGASLPQAKPGAFRALSAEGSVKTTGADAVEIALASLAFDDIRANGSVAVNYGGAMAINANLSTGPLDLRPYIAASEAPPEGGDGWSKEPIDLSALGAMTGDFKVRAESVTLPEKIALGRSDITAKLRSGRLDLNIRELGVFGGGLVGDVSVDGRNGNAIAANISTSAVQMLPMLQALADIGLLEGLGRADVNVRGAGGSLHQIMNSLDGSGSFKLEDGAIRGYDIAGMVRNVQSALTGGGGGGSQKTDFSEVSGTFDINDGLLTNADFQFLGPLLRIVGEGTVDLGGQSVNFRVTPKAVASLTGQGGSVDDKGLAFPLIVSGPWSKLSIRPDLQGGIENLLKDPEGAAKAVEDLIDGVKDGGAEGAVGAAIGSITGGEGGGNVVDDAKKAIDDAKKGDPSAILNAITGGGGDGEASGDDDPAGKLIRGLFGNN
ncbi:MAG: AsmA family protein [Pseudomonadota bacterium]